MKKFLKTVSIIIITIAVVVFGINFIVVGTTRGNIQEKITTEDNISIDTEIIQDLKEQKGRLYFSLGRSGKTGRNAYCNVGRPIGNRSVPLQAENCKKITPIRRQWSN